MRRDCKKVSIGSTYIGGNSRILVQSMLNIPADNIEDNVKQAVQLEKAGCDIIRVAIPNMESIKLIHEIKNSINIPLVADIHFNYKLAIEAVNAGVDKIRINPGNIGDDNKVRQVAQICKSKGVPIRIGVNSGSLEKSILAKYQHPCPEALVDSALYHAALLEKFDFDDIVISIKSSDVNVMVKAYREIAQKCNYPLHLGVTEAGTEKTGIVKSSIGIGALLLDGIGDTIRVSLTADPIKEVSAGLEILKALDLNNNGIQFISCPTCGRTKIDLIKIANEVQERLIGCKKKIKVAIMGCAVNGPGEAREADIGIAGGDGIGLIFKKGEIIRKVPENELIDELIKEIDLM